MILDVLRQSTRYKGLYPHFDRALTFFARTDLASLPAGRHVLDGERLYISIDQKEGRGREGARLEAHRKYIDIQFTIEGDEEIGWMPTSGCMRPIGLFDAARDILFYEDRPTTWVSSPTSPSAVMPTLARRSSAASRLLSAIARASPSLHV